MMSDLETLRARVLDTAKASPVGPRVADVTLEPDEDEYGDAYLRIMVHVTGPDDRAEDRIFLALIERIEDVVEAIDERHTSVRFREAA